MSWVWLSSVTGVDMLAVGRLGTIIKINHRLVFDLVFAAVSSFLANLFVTSDLVGSNSSASLFGSPNLSDVASLSDVDALILFAQQSMKPADEGATSLLFGDVATLMQLIMLALGAALLFGNGFALIRPPSSVDQSSQPDDSEQPPQLNRSRTIVMAVIGLFITAVACVSLIP